MPTYLGAVCKRGHDHGGGSLRRRDNNDCVDCATHRQHERSAAAGPVNYLGGLCKRGHDHEGSGQSLRNRKTRQCKACIAWMMRERRKDPAVREKERQYDRRWRATHPDPNASTRRCIKARLKRDPEFALLVRLRCNLYAAMKRHTQGGKVGPSKKYGIDYPAIIAHLGPPPGPGYQVDHIRPCVSFDLDDPQQVKLCYAPDNLQWLTADANRSKGASRGR